MENKSQEELLKKHWKYNPVYDYVDHDTQIKQDLQVSPNNKREFSCQEILDIIKESAQFGSELRAERAKEKIEALLFPDDCLLFKGEPFVDREKVLQAIEESKI